MRRFPSAQEIDVSTENRRKSQLTEFRRHGFQWIIRILIASLTLRRILLAIESIAAE